MMPDQLDYRIVEDKERARWLGGVANKIEGWCTPDPSFPICKRIRYLQRQPDAAIIVTPEGYGKSSLVAYLLDRNFKVVFCTKSNAQLLAKEREMRTLSKPPIVTRYESKAQHLYAELAALGIGPDAFRLPSYEKESPYGIAAANEVEAVKLLTSVFAEVDLALDAESFFKEHYTDYGAPPIDGSTADVILLSFAAFQAFCRHGRPWWQTLGLVESIEEISVVKKGVEKIIAVRRPFEKVAVIIDDPDRGDVDWLRRVSAKTAQVLVEKRMATDESGTDEGRDTRIVRLKESFFEKRPLDQLLGHRLKSANERSRFRPKMIVTTTETVTARYALQTLERSGLKVDTTTEVFRTPMCNVTAIQTTITRKRNQAVLLPIVECLREEFPAENATLIADGLGCEFNLSNNKGRNDLQDRTTIVKLSWPHPNVIATAYAHLTEDERRKSGLDVAMESLDISPDQTPDAPGNDLEAFEDIVEPISDAEVQNEIDLAMEHLGTSHDETVSILLGDLANQALGRNQGFRFQDKEAILLIDPRWYPAIIKHDVLRYRLTPWSTELPALNKKTSKKSVWNVLLWHGAKPSQFQKRFIELIRTFETFGLSDKARELIQKLPSKQQTHFQKWLEKKIEEQPELDIALNKKRDANREAVQRHRARRKAEPI